MVALQVHLIYILAQEVRCLALKLVPDAPLAILAYNLRSTLVSSVAQPQQLSYSLRLVLKPKPVLEEVMFDNMVL